MIESTVPVKRFDSKSAFSAFKPCDVSFVLWPSRSPFILQKMITSDDGNLQSFDFNFETFRPGILKLDSINRRQDINTARGQPDLKYGSWSFEIIECQASQRRSKV